MSDSTVSEKVRFTCDHCKKEVAVSANKAGQEIACPTCYAALMVPASGGEEAAPQSASAEAAAPQREERPAPEPVAATQPIVEQREPTFAPALQANQHSVSAPTVEPADTGARVARQAALEGRASGSGANRRGVRAPKKASKLPLVMVCVGIVLAVAIGVGMVVARGMKLAALHESIGQQHAQAEARLQDGEIEAAARHVKKARQLIDTSDQPLDPELTKKWDAGFTRIEEYQQRLAEVDALLKEAAREPARIKTSLEEKRIAAEAQGELARPIVNKLTLALEEVKKAECEKILKGLNKEMDAAEALYRDGKVEEAVDQALGIQNRLLANDQLRDEKLKTRIDHLRSHAERYNQARSVRAGASGDFAGAIKQLQTLAAQLDAAKPEHKPILDYIAQAEREIQDAEKASKRITPGDVERLKKLANHLAQRESGVEVGAANTAHGVQLDFEGVHFWLALTRSAEGEAEVFLKAGTQEFSVNEKLLMNRPGLVLCTLRRLAGTMKDLPAGARWELVHEAPFPVARRVKDGKTELFFEGRLYQGQEGKLDESAAKKALQDAAAALALAVENDAVTREEVRKVVGTLVRGTYKELAKNDYLPGWFCRRALADKYVERNIPGAGERLGKELAAYYAAHAEYVRPQTVFKGDEAAGGAIEQGVNGEGMTLFRVFDKERNVTAFGLEHPSEERPLFFVVQEYDGNLAEFPKDREPKTVRMTHPAVGVLASYDVAGKRFEFEQADWRTAADMTVPRNLPSCYGQASWAFPPHAVILDEHRDAKAIITPAGRLDFPDFSAIQDANKLRAALDQFIADCAAVLNSTGYLNLYYVYFHQYTLDSPVTEATQLLGSSAHCGDIHQTVHQSLERCLGGRLLGDCDDLAELFQVITEKQGKLSFVMALPAHAACGWVEKDPNGNYVMQFLQTGPPLIVEGPTLDGVVEEGSRLHDHDKTMRFDPKSLGYLFRFAGEPTRTPYWLSTRMFVDKEYAETMERVQGYWHFHFYALGIQVMEEMIAKGDNVPENCTELAGLYGQVKETDKAIHWIDEATKQLGPGDMLTRTSEAFRKAQYLKRDRGNDEAYAAVKGLIPELKSLNRGQDILRYANSRMELASLLTSIDRPWEAFDLIEDDANRFRNLPPHIPYSHGHLLTGIYEKMAELTKEKGYTPSAHETAAQNRIEQVLKWFFGSRLFQPDDDFNDIMRKYGSLAQYYEIIHGRDTLVAELLKDGPWPAGKRNHANRASANLDEDWKWVRVSLLAYLMEIGEAIDPEKPKEEWRIEDAVKLAEAMERAAVQCQQFGSLGTAEFFLYTTRTIHACLTKDWGKFRQIMELVKEKNWARITREVAETFGACARFMTPQEFLAQYKVFAQHVDAKASYFNVVYEAYRNECFDHARLAAQEAVKRWPDDENMKREARYLDQLIESRKAELKKKEEQKKAAPPEKKPGALLRIAPVRQAA